ncbi:MAG: hypothetical protein M0Z67_08435 [Nitrospiraceae bacterium]|nr:hypothetical protein [Nitrospiraceae bacterium]
MTGRKRRICSIVAPVVLTVFVSAVFLSYLYYRDLKKTLLAEMSGKASAFVGQPVAVGDISFSLFNGITITDIQIRNPEGFPPGRLLAVKKVFFDIDYRALPEGEIHLKKILLSLPELTIAKDREGRPNISDALMRLLSRKSTIRYRIDALSLTSGSITVGNDPLLKNEEIDMTLKNLSSLPDTTTAIEGSTLWATNKVKIEGRASLSAEPKKFGISLSADDLNFSPFREFLSNYHIDADRIQGGILVSAEGDTAKGIAVSSALRLKSPASFYRKKLLDIRMDADVFYDIPSHSADIRTLTVKMGNTQVISAKGEIRNLHGSPLYDFGMKVENLDLSVFDFVEGTRVKGIVTSGPLRVKGRMTGPLPEVSGSVSLKNGSVNAKTLDVRNVDGRMTFSSGREMSADMDVSATFAKIAGYLLTKPADARLSLSAHGLRRNVTLAAGLTALPFVIEIRGNGNASLGDLRVSLDGTLQEKNFSGKSSFQAAKIKYKDYLLKGLKGAVGIGYAGRVLTIGSPEIKTDIFSLGAESVRVKPLGPKEGFQLEAKGLNATYPSEKAALKGLAVSGRLYTAGTMSGDFEFSLAEAIFRGAAAKGISGKTSFSDKKFSLDVPRAGIAGGRISIVAEGLISGGPFPVKAEMSAEHADIGELVRPFMKEKPGYGISGDAEKAVFSGTIDSAESSHGKLTIDLRKVSVLDEKTKRRLLKDATLRSEVEFQGDTCSFTADASAGKVEAAFTGTARDFLGEGRSVLLQGHLAETPATEIRNTFWDIFPDALLYSGMDGSLSSDLRVDYQKGGIVVDGDLRLREFMLTGENDEYSIGPITGTVPIVYGHTGEGMPPGMPSFERADFDKLKKSYAAEFTADGYRRISVGSFRYGFRLLRDITVWVKPEKGGLKIGRFSANIFGGRLSGSAVVDLADRLRYRVGFVLDGLSLTRLCDDIEPIKGYISGKVDGVGLVRGSGTDLRQLIGKTDFWTYSTKDEETKVSREFLQKIGGPSLKAYIGDRNFDKGEMILYLQNGFVIFRELEISHRNLLGMQDLSVKVAPLSNKISLDDLMWSIVEAASRAGKKGQ